MGIQSAAVNKHDIKMCNRDMLLYALTFGLLSFAVIVAADFHEDEFVPTSRRAQFHGVSY